MIDAYICPGYKFTNTIMFFNILHSTFSIKFLDFLIFSKFVKIKFSFVIFIPKGNVSPQAFPVLTQKLKYFQIDFHVAAGLG